MSGATMDPSAQAESIWSNALTLLRSNSTLTAREKGWFESVVPEAVFGTTIILTVENNETLQVLQTELNQQLLQALELANGGISLFPAFKIVPKAAEAELELDLGTPEPEPTPLPEPKRPAPVPEKTRIDTSAPLISHYDDAVVQTFDDIIPEDGFDTNPATTLTGSNSEYSLDPETHLNRNATFDTFIPGSSNVFAKTVALAVAEGTGRDFNPLFIYGGSGLGKTHLLNAIGNYALLKQPKTRVRYVTSEEFTNEFIDSLRTDKSESHQIQSESHPIGAFNKKYREVDVLLIDDIQFLGGKTQTLEQFFHTFNSLYQKNKRIVIASDVPPKNLEDFEDRLISRFEQGLQVDVQPPDIETRIAILRMIAYRSKATIPNDVLDLIAERFTDNIRELEGALNRVTALASLNNQPITRVLAEQTLRDFFSTSVEVTPTDIISRVAKYFHLTFDDLVGPSRQKNIIVARQIAMYLTRDLTSMSLVNIGQIFGGRDHTTVMHNCKIVSEGMQERQDIYTYVTELTVQLRKHLTE